MVNQQIRIGKDSKSHSKPSDSYIKMLEIPIVNHQDPIGKGLGLMVNHQVPI